MDCLAAMIVCISEKEITAIFRKIHQRCWRKFWLSIKPAREREMTPRFCLCLALASVINKGCVQTVSLSGRSRYAFSKGAEALATAWQTGKSQKGNGLHWGPYGSIYVLLNYIVFLAVECNKQSWSSFEKLPTCAVQITQFAAD
ncbi:Early nodulin-36B [Spatholobus suberectus]|nr:Early nodulin-36B [Spatholobus suberectus]